VIELPDRVAVPSAVTLDGGAATVTVGSELDGYHPPGSCGVIDVTEPLATSAVAVAVMRVGDEKVTVGGLV
jgi:hypothetical protein